MTRIAIILIAAVAFFLSGCSTTRKTTATETQAEAQLTATTAGQQHTEATAQATTTEDTAIKANVSAAQQEATEAKTEEKPKFTFWDWLYIIVVGGFSVYALIFAVKLIIKTHNAAKRAANSESRAGSRGARLPALTFSPG